MDGKANLKPCFCCLVSGSATCVKPKLLLNPKPRTGWARSVSRFGGFALNLNQYRILVGCLTHISRIIPYRRFRLFRCAWLRARTFRKFWYREKEVVYDFQVQFRTTSVLSKTQVISTCFPRVPHYKDFFGAGSQELGFGVFGCRALCHTLNDLSIELTQQILSSIPFKSLQEPSASEIEAGKAP